MKGDKHILLRLDDASKAELESARIKMTTTDNAMVRSWEQLILKLVRDYNK